MNEQAAAGLLGAMGTALVTAVGALAWMVRQRNGHHANPGLGETPEATQLLRELVTLTRVHNAEAAGRHTAIIEALRQQERSR